MDEGGVAASAIEGAHDVTGLRDGRVPEGLHLEYKLKQDASTPELSKDDRRSVAEAIVAFANSDGGTLVYGVGSERRDGMDVASSLVPIARVDAFATQVRLVAELNVSPNVRSVEVRAVRAEDGGDAGYVVVRVPRSDARPHMSTAPNVHRYYRRTFTGSAIMTPSEVREQILATREAVLAPTVTLGGGGTLQARPDWVGVQAGFSVRLRNVGTRLCRDPFLRVAASCTLDSHGLVFDARLGAWKSDYATGLLIHVDDEGPAASLRFLARVEKAPFRRHAELDQRVMLDAVTIHPAADLHSGTSFAAPGLEGIDLIVTYGADNATARSQGFRFGRDRLAAGVLAGLGTSLRDMMGDVGVWRQDLINALPRDWTWVPGN